MELKEAIKVFTSKNFTRLFPEVRYVGVGFSEGKFTIRVICTEKGKTEILKKV